MLPSLLLIVVVATASASTPSWDDSLVRDAAVIRQLSSENKVHSMVGIAPLMSLSDDGNNNMLVSPLSSNRFQGHRFLERKMVSINNHNKGRRIHETKMRKIPFEPASTTKRNLFTAGHLADVILGGCDASDVYQHTDYDDNYQPECECWQRLGQGDIVLRCQLNDDTCEDVTGSGDNATQAQLCTNTHELFFFSDNDGDIRTKGSCTFCSSDSTEGVCEDFTEYCTYVRFNNTRADVLAQADDQPDSCRVVTYTNNDGDRDFEALCDDCSICGTGTDTDPFGIRHSCFGLTQDPSYGQCNRDGFAHLHNFVPTGDGSAPPGGAYAEVCGSAVPAEVALYGTVQYDNGYAVVCDCQDASATVTCDLHYPQCFANLCTDVTEQFFFDKTTGEFEAKWTINWVDDRFKTSEVSIWTQTEFDTNTGVPTECGVIDENPNTGQLARCTNCQICSTNNGAFYGIRYNCFGTATTGTCDTRFGRAQFNFVAPNPPPKPEQPSLFIGDSSGDSSNDFLSSPLFLAVVFGGFAVFLVAATFAVVLTRRHYQQQSHAAAVRRAGVNPADQEGMTVASADDCDDLSLAPSEDPRHVL